MAVILALVWTYTVRFRPTFDLGGVQITFAPILRTLFWPILLVLLSGAPQGFVSLHWPSRLRLHSSLRLAIDVVTLVVLAVLLNAHSWVNIASPKFPAAGIEQATAWTNFGVWIALVVVAIAIAVDALREARRIFRPRAAGAHPLPLAGSQPRSAEKQAAPPGWVT